MKWLCCFSPDQELQEGTTQLVPGTAARAGPVQSVQQTQQGPKPADVQPTRVDQQHDLLAAEQRAGLGRLVAGAASAHSSRGSRHRNEAAADLASATVQQHATNTQSRAPAPTPFGDVSDSGNAQASAVAPHPLRLQNLPADSPTNNVDRVEEWLSFSLSGSHRSPTSSPRSDHEPMPPGAPEAESDPMHPANIIMKPAIIADEELYPTSQQPGIIPEPEGGLQMGAAPVGTPLNPPSRTRSRDEVSAVPDEVLSAIQHIAGVPTVAALRESRSGALGGSSGGLFTQTAPAASHGGHALTDPSPSFRRSGSGSSHPFPASRAPLGEPGSVYGARSRLGSASLPPPPDSPTAAGGVAGAAPADASGRSSPHETPHAPLSASPAPSISSASAPSRIVLDGALSMLHNRPLELNGAMSPAPIPDALSQALEALHARSASLEGNALGTRGPPLRSRSHGSTPQGSALHNGSTRTLGRPHSMHTTPTFYSNSGEHAVTYPPERAQRQPARSQHGAATARSAGGGVGGGRAASTSASAADTPGSQSGGPSPPLLIPSGLPGGDAMKMRVTKLFFGGTEDGASHGLHPDPVLDTSNETQDTQMEGSRSGGIVGTSVCQSLGVLEQPENDTLSSSGSSVSMVTPLQHHASVSTMGYSGAPKPSTEEKRMGRLCALNVLETAPEAKYDRITALVAQVFSTPVVLVSLVDSDRQWFKSVAGLPGVTETSRELSFCAWTLLPQDPECLVVSDARNDARFRNNALVAGAPHIKFYAGCPLVSSSGQRLGSLCAIDTRTRYFTAEDCNLLCNLAEITVRELEALDAQEQKMFDAEDTSTERLRAAEAWDVGLLVLHIGDRSWRIRHANGRAGEVLGVADLGSFIGTDFWDFFSLKDPPPGVHPSSRFRLQLLQGQDLTFDTSVFTDEGQKLWITCTMRSGTQSQVDDNCPLVSVPMDLVSEPGTKAGYWFVSMKPMTETNSRFPKMGVPCFTSSNNPCFTSSNHSCYAEHFENANLTGMLLLTQLSSLPRSQIHSALHVPHARSELPTPEEISVSGDWVMSEVILTEDPGALLPLMHDKNTLWADAGLMHGVHALMDVCRVELGEGALMLLRPVPHPINLSLRSAMHEGVFKVVPTADEIYNGVVTSDTLLAISTALHLARSLELLHAASLVHGDLSDASVVVSMPHHRSSPGETLHIGRNFSVAFATFGFPAHPASAHAGPRGSSSGGEATAAFPRGLAAADGSGGAGGSGGGGVATTANPSPGVAAGGGFLQGRSSWDTSESPHPPLPGSIPPSFDTPPSLGPPSSAGGMPDMHPPCVGVVPEYLDDLAAVRPDLPIFYAPERFDGTGKLLERCEPAADIWSLGMLLIYMLRVSLPLVNDGPLTLQQKARQGTLLSDVLEMAETSIPPEAGTLISLCLSSNPHVRPSASRCAAALEHIQSTLLQEKAAADAAATETTEMSAKAEDFSSSSAGPSSQSSD